MKAYLVADITIHDLDTFKQYVELVPAFIEKHGGNYLVRGGDPSAHEGNWEPKRLIVIEFPSRENAEAFINDPGYAPVAAIRHRSADTNLVLANGY